MFLFKKSNFFFWQKQEMSRKNENGLFAVSIGGVKINVEIADTEEKRIKGLSGRKALTENEGMLFIFENPGIYYFWMKDMLFWVDIIWIDETGGVLGVAENLSPESYPFTFAPDASVKYVLEVNGGFAKKNSITTGDIIVFPSNEK